MTTESTDKRRCHRRLYQLIAEDVEQLELLEHCMNGIGAAIVRRDQSQLKQLLDAQTALIEEMEARSEERRALVEALGFDARAGGVEAAIRWCDETGQLYALWLRLTVGATAYSSEQGAGLAILSQCQDRLRRTLTSMLGPRPVPLAQMPLGDASMAASSPPGAGT